MAASDDATAARLLAWAVRAAGAAGDEASVDGAARRSAARIPQLVDGLVARGVATPTTTRATEALALLEAVGARQRQVPRRLPVIPD